MFGRATIRLGIGPHSSYSYCDFVRTLHRRKALLVGLLKFKLSFSILCILFLESLIVLSLSAMHSCTA